MNSPLGPLTLEASHIGLRRVSFGGSGTGSSPLLEEAASQLGEYFAGKRLHFDLALDASTQGFRAEVQTALSDIGYGKAVSYSQLAATCGYERAVRAVGSACANNPLLIIRPCHRVLRADGSIGGYAGGPEAKRWLLEHEQRVAGNLSIAETVQ
ncbi:methylated-DNA--[protein]-cysteine S-methyltransferase [Corynebacterium alimapuense]|uniref:methylated-DNA--[protein]-cysteine S-methyltransferase n=1 Tax=Corynebacterium alimapuense TaxID=1576874 RepID=A0A3M8K7F6_9CORY|nr:methylated-DNA--[protein]-cysteine S-methyltransferase [Corynebacterium alimapuense]